jgi:ATP synthase protein I
MAKPDDDKAHFDFGALRQATSLGAVGIEMGGSVAVGCAIGFYLDKWLGTRPWMLVIWTILGLGAAANAVYSAYRKAKKVGQEDEPGDQERH